MTLTTAPTLATARLTLRGPVATDFEPLAAFFAEERSSGFGGPLPRDEAWRWFALNIGHWHLHGYGFFTVTETESGAPVGIVGLWNPEGWPEPELGWVMFANAEGKGYAREAAERVRLWAYDDLGWTTLTSNIVPGNDRSAVLAERMGAWFERIYVNPNMGEDRLFRHPGPDALADARGSDADGSPEAYA